MPNHSSDYIPSLFPTQDDSPSYVLWTHDEPLSLFDFLSTNLKQRVRIFKQLQMLYVDN